MGMTRRTFVVATSVAAAGAVMGLSGCTMETDEREPIMPSGTLAFDNDAWNYDSSNDVYWQVGIVYCENPATTAYESMGLYVPGAYLDGTKNDDGTYSCTINYSEKVGNWTAETAPIVMPVNTAGYSAQPAPTNYSFGGEASEYLKVGFIFLDAGCRGRDNGYANDGTLEYSGGAPWGVTDLKAAIRYLRYNDLVLPGNKDAIFTFGHSGGGAQSAIVGATGDSELYIPYLEKIGAAVYDDNGVYINDSIAGSMCWCPITCLDEADSAYEWMMGQYSTSGTRASGTWTAQMSKDLSEAYADYINNLGLKNNNTALKLEKSDENVYAAGTYYDYMRDLIEESLNNFLSDTEFPYTPSSSEMGGGPGGDMGGGMPGGDSSGGTGGMSGMPGGDMSSDMGGMPGEDMSSDMGSMPGGDMSSDMGGMPGGDMSGNTGSDNTGGNNTGSDNTGGNNTNDQTSDSGATDSPGANARGDSTETSNNNANTETARTASFVVSMPGGSSDSSSDNQSSGSTDTGPGGNASGGMPSGSTSSGSSTYQTAQDYIDSLNAGGEWITYDEATNTAKVASVGDFTRNCKLPSKSVGAFDDIDRSQAENKVFGNDENDALHFDATMTQLLQDNKDEYAALSNWDSSLPKEYESDREQTDSLGTDMDTRVGMYNPLYYMSSYYDGNGKSHVAPHWRIRTGIEQGDTSLCVEANLSLALKACSDVEDVDFETVWGQGHTQAERTGSSSTNFIEWIENCLK